jgi:D-alanyl-D-alanine carboxypeptidase
MSVLGRHVIYDFPQYYNLFSRRSANAGVATVRHTNRRWLDSYAGGDGIKTGYTRAAGFNLVASAQRGQERVIATVFGGSSTSARNARITELMDMGFNRAPTRATIRRPNPPAAMLTGEVTTGNPGKTIRVSGLVTTSLRPVARPTAPVAAPVEEPVLVAATPPVAQEPVVVAAAAPPVPAVPVDVLSDAINAAVVEALEDVTPPATVQIATTTPAVTPVARPTTTGTQVAALDTPPTAVAVTGPEVVTRISTSGGRHWGVNVGRYDTRYNAERVLLKVALNEMTALDGALRRVTQRSGGFDANFMGLTREGADLACRRLQARGTMCFMIGSEG